MASYLYYKGVIYKDKVHRPLGVDERLSGDSIPVSGRAGNGIRVVDDGLYVGGQMDQAAYYVAAAGTDDPASGTKAAPYKTLDYALAQIVANYDKNNPGNTTLRGNPTIALKAGETFPMTTSYNLIGLVTLTFWGDATYGDFNGPLVGSPGTDPALMQDLNRPIIAPAINPATSNGVHHFLAVGGTASEAILRLSGVRVDLPTGIVQDSDYCSFFTVFYSQAGKLQLNGAVINKLDTASSYGLMGMHARTGWSILEQYSSQFWVNGVPVGAGSAIDALQARKWFIIFYPDLQGNNQTGGHLLNGPPGSGLLQLLWTDVPQTPVLPGKNNLPTFPVINNDPAFGIGNYFYNLNRDQQGRPLNAIAPYLF